MGLLILYAVLSISFSFLCSVVEASLLSVTHTFINIKKQEGKSFADKLEKLKSDIDVPLISLLTVNTVANTAGALLVGVQAEKVFGSGNGYVFYVSVVMTVLILLVSEIIPKTIGAMYWHKLAGFVTVVLNIFVSLLRYTGLLWILLFITRLISKNKDKNHSLFSREDFEVMAELAEEEGVFEETESNIIKNIISFNETPVNDIMTPRSVMFTAQRNEKIKDFLKENPEIRFSRIPLFDEDPDDIHSYVLKDRIFEAMVKGQGDKKLKSLERDLLETQRDESVSDLFQMLIKHKEHIALVRDEYGSVTGLVTQEDAIETLLGFEIVDETDKHENMQQLAREQYGIEENEEDDDKKDNKDS